VAHGVAARAHLVVAIAILGEWRAGTADRGDVAGLGAQG
jgi:hypothetical protein